MHPLQKEANRIGTRNFLRNEHDGDIEAVCRAHDVERADLLGRSRIAWIVTARADLAHRLRNKGLSYPVIGLIMDRDHTSVMHLVGVTAKGKECAEKYDRKTCNPVGGNQ